MPEIQASFLGIYFCCILGPVSRQPPPAPFSLNGCLGHTERGARRGVGERLAKGWRKFGEGLAKGWRVSLHPPTLQFPKRLFRRAGL